MNPKLTVAFEIQDGWPTPNSVCRAADALDALCNPRYGAILRAYADAEDARYEAHGPYIAAIRDGLDKAAEEARAAVTAAGVGVGVGIDQAQEEAS